MNGHLKFALLVVLCFQHSLLTAAIKRWDGSSSGLWSVGANWEDGTAPQNGDQLRFPGGGVTRRTVTNNISNLRLTEAFFEGADSGGYIIRGNPLTLTGGQVGPNWGSQSTTSNRIELDITLDNAFANGSFGTTGGGALAMAGDLTISAFTLLRSVGGLHISGAIGGTGDIECNGDIVFSGSTPNTYSGTTFVTVGTLQLNKVRFTGTAFVGVTSIPGDLRIGQGSGTDIVQLLFSDQIANTANVQLLMNAPLPGNIALLDLNGVNETIDSITIGGGIIRGNGGLLTLNGDVDMLTSTLISTINSDISLSTGTHTITVRTNTVNPDLEIVGVISGAGSIVKAGLGTLAFGGSTDNSYTGTTTVNEGVLQLSKTNAFALGANAVLVIGQSSPATPSDVVRYTANNQLRTSNPVTVNSSGVLDLNNFDDDIGGLTLNGGTVQSGPSGTIQLRGNVTAVGVPQGFTFDQALISGNLDLGVNNRTFTVNNDPFLNGFPTDLAITADITGTGGIVKTGAGELALSGASAFTGAVTVNQGELIASSATALGATNSGTTVNNDASLILDDALVLGEPLTLSSSASAPAALVGTGTTNLWTGAITLAQPTVIGVDQDAALNLQCPISGTGGLEKGGAGLLKFSGGAPNTYSGVTTVSAGTLFCDHTGLNDGSIPGDLVIGDGVGGADADLVFYSFTQINNSSRVTITDSGKLVVGADTIGSLTGTGTVEVLNTGELRTGANNDSTTYAGLIIGGGGITKQGTGTFTVTRNNSYTGPTLVQAGTLIVNGSQSGSDVTVALDAILGGRGSIGDLQVNGGGIVSPGVSPARLSARNTVFGNEGRLVIELNGPAAGSQYDQLGVSGTLNVTSAELQVTLNHAPLDGHVFNIVDNNGTDAVVGTFDLLPNGSIITLNQIPLRLNYNGGTGNDITLTVTNLPLHAARASIATGDRNGRIDVNECNELFLAITNSSGSALSVINATLTTTTPNVFITEDQSAYPNIPAGGTRTNSIPFQFFTTPEFPCGADITFILTVTTPANGTFALSYTLSTGQRQSPVTFNNNTAVAIPDGSATASPITVSGVSGGIAEVSVSLFLTHNGLANLQVFLVSPDGFTLPMVIGASGTSLGTTCAAANRMVLDDDATRTIASGPAPYVGEFKPVAPLSLFDGKSGTRLNGTWLLRVIDPVPDGIPGSLSCWSLTITPATCTDGGGICAPCNGPFIGSITTNDLKSTRVLLPPPAPSVCGTSAGTCSTANRTGFYDAFTFTNGGPDACVTVTLSTLCGTNENALYSAAFLNNYNPSNPCPSRIGFLGPLPDPDGTYSFLIASNAVFTVIVSSVNTSFSGCSNYVLSVDGFECPVELGFRRSSAGFVIDWPTHGVGFVPECTTNLAIPNWTALTNEPRSADGKLVITNTISGPNAFYRLRRP